MRTRSYWHVFPRWLKMLTYWVALPAWLGFVAMIFTGLIGEFRLVGLALFAAFGLVGLCQLVVIIRAVWRNEV